MRKEDKKAVAIGTTEAAITHDVRLMIVSHGVQAIRLDMK